MYKLFFSKIITNSLFFSSGICLLLQFVGCVKDIDFDQINDVELAPVFDVNFVYAKFDTDVFHQNSTVFVPEVVVKDTMSYDLLGIDFAVKHLEKVELTFEFENTIERDFEFDFGFLNSEGERVGPTYTMIAKQGNGRSTVPVTTIKQITMSGGVIDEVEFATKLVSSLRIHNVTGSLQGVFQLRSKGSYYINYKL